MSNEESDTIPADALLSIVSVPEALKTFLAKIGPLMAESQNGDVQDH